MGVNIEKYKDNKGITIFRKVCNTRKDAIKIFCIECMGLIDRRSKMQKVNLDPIRDCTDLDCPLYPFRIGKNPFSKRKGNPDALRKASMTV